MGEITSFPIQTKTIDELEILSAANAQPTDPLMVFDESAGVWKVISIGDVVKGDTILLDSVANLSQIDGSLLLNHQSFRLKSFSPNGFHGGGFLVWDSTIPKLEHDGERYFSPSVPAPTDFNNQFQVNNYKNGIGEMYPTEDGVFVLTISAYDIDQIDTYADFSKTRLNIGQVVYLKQHTSGGIGGGEFIGVSSSGKTINPGHIAATLDPAVFSERINYVVVTPDQFGALGGGADDRVACQAAIDFCNSFAKAKELVLLRMHTTSGTLFIDIPTDSAKADFVVRGSGGGFIINTEITMFSSRLPYLIAPPYGNNPCTERVRFLNVQFQGNPAHFNATVCDDKYLRTTFDSCYFLGIAHAIKDFSTGYLQSISVFRCKDNLRNESQYLIDTKDAYEISVLECQFENTGLGARFSNIVRGIRLKNNLYQGSGGEFLRVSGGATIVLDGNYFEGNGGPEVVFGDSGGVVSGVSITNNFWLLHEPFASDSNYYPIITGQARHIELHGNAINGNLVNNSGAMPFSIEHSGNEVPGNRRVTNINTLSDLDITADPSGTQAGAYVLKTRSNIVTTAVANASVRLPITLVSQEVESITVRNSTPVTINVYPSSGQMIRGTAINAPFPIASGQSVEFFNSVVGNFWSA